MFSPAAPWLRQLLPCLRRDVHGQIGAEAVDEGAGDVGQDGPDQQGALLAPVLLECRLCFCQDFNDVAKGICVLHGEGEELDPSLSVLLVAHQGVPDHHPKGCHVGHGKGGSLEDVRTTLNGPPVYEVSQGRELGGGLSA